MERVKPRRGPGQSVADILANWLQYAYLAKVYVLRWFAFKV